MAVMALGIMGFMEAVAAKRFAIPDYDVDLRVAPGERFRVQVGFSTVAALPASAARGEAQGGPWDRVDPLPLLLSAGFGGVVVMNWLARRRRHARLSVRGEALPKLPAGLAPETLAVLASRDWRQGYPAAVFRLAEAGKLQLHQYRAGWLQKSLQTAAIARAAPETAENAFGSRILAACQQKPVKLEKLLERASRDRQPRASAHQALLAQGLLREKPAHERSNLRNRARLLGGLAIVLMGGGVALQAGWAALPGGWGTGLAWAAGWSVPLISGFGAGLALALLAWSWCRYEPTDQGLQACQAIRQHLRRIQHSLHERREQAPGEAVRAFFQCLPWLAIDPERNLRIWSQKVLRPMRSARLGSAAVLPAWLLLEKGTAGDAVLAKVADVEHVTDALVQATLPHGTANNPAPGAPGGGGGDGAGGGG